MCGTLGESIGQAALMVRSRSEVHRVSTTEALAKAQRAKNGKRVTSPEGFEPSFQP